MGSLKDAITPRKKNLLNNVQGCLWGFEKKAETFEKFKFLIFKEGFFMIFKQFLFPSSRLRLNAFSSAWFSFNVVGPFICISFPGLSPDLDSKKPAAQKLGVPWHRLHI